MSELGAGHGHHHSDAEPDWNQHYAGEAPVWSGDPNTALVAEAASLPAARALDVGCGEGADAIWLAGRGWQVTAIDVSSMALARAKDASERSGVEVDWRLTGLLDLPEDEPAFDLVSVFYPALRKQPHGATMTERDGTIPPASAISQDARIPPASAMDRDATAALLGAVAPGGTLLAVHHADMDREKAHAHGFNPDDYVTNEDVAAALDDNWEIQVREQRDRTVSGGGGAGHNRDLVLRARRIR